MRRSTRVVLALSLLLPSLLSPAPPSLPAADDCFLEVIPGQVQGTFRFRAVSEKDRCPQQRGTCHAQTSFTPDQKPLVNARCIGADPDPLIRVRLTTSPPIRSFPATRFFNVLDGLTVETPQGTFEAFATGGVIAEFVPRASNPAILEARIRAMSLKIMPATGGTMELAGLLPVSLPFIGTSEDPPGTGLRLVAGPSFLVLDAGSGLTTGAVSASIFQEGRVLSFRGDMTGTLDFARGIWTLTISGDRALLDPDMLAP